MLATTKFENKEKFEQDYERLGFKIGKFDNTGNTYYYKPILSVEGFNEYMIFIVTNNGEIYVENYLDGNTMVDLSYQGCLFSNLIAVVAELVYSGYIAVTVNVCEKLRELSEEPDSEGEENG